MIEPKSLDALSEAIRNTIAEENHLLARIPRMVPYFALQWV